MTNLPNPSLHVLGLWEEAGVCGENPRAHKENVQDLHTQNQTQHRLAVRQVCKKYFSFHINVNQIKIWSNEFHAHPVFLCVIYTIDSQMNLFDPISLKTIYVSCYLYTNYCIPIPETACGL